MANMNLENEIFETGKPYFTLVVYDTEDKQWINEFSDYDKQSILDEMDECFFEVKPKHLKILKTSDNQKEIDAAINKLNGEDAKINLADMEEIEIEALTKMAKKELIDACLDQIVKDIESGDLTAIEELLVQVLNFGLFSEEILKAFLSEVEDD